MTYFDDAIFVNIISFIFDNLSIVLESINNKSTYNSIELSYRKVGYSILNKHPSDKFIYYYNQLLLPLLHI